MDYEDLIDEYSDWLANKWLEERNLEEEDLFPFTTKEKIQQRKKAERTAERNPHESI